MRRSIDTYIKSLIHDNESFFTRAGFKSVAEYLIYSSDENGLGWNDMFDDDELEPPTCEPTKSQIEEVKKYILDNYNYLP